MTTISPDFVGYGFWDNLFGRFKKETPPPAPPAPIPQPPALAVPTPTFPPLSVLKKMADISYEKVVQPGTVPEGYTLVQTNETLKFFKSNNSPMFVVGIRGTADARDLRADALILLNKAEGSARYKEDLATIKEFQSRYPVSQYTYYGVGHSYGGFELDGFIKAGLIERGVSYNPAIAQEDFKNTDLSNKNYRIYSSGDPLYKLMGQFDSPKEVRTPAPLTWTQQLANLIPGVGVGYNSYKQHSLDNPIFTGGRRRWGNLFGRGGRTYKCPPVKLLQRVPKGLFDDLYTMLNHSSLAKGSATIYGLVSSATGRGKVRISQSSLHHPEIAREIFRIGRDVCPFPFKSVAVLHNVKVPKHRDSQTTHLAMVVSFGEYTGGVLLIDDKPTDTYLRPVIFNGAECEHHTSGEIKGDKYSLVFYNNLKRADEAMKGAGSELPPAPPPTAIPIGSPFHHLRGSAVPRSGALVKKYKEMGGRYKEETKGKRSGRPLKRWFEERLSPFKPK